MRDTIFSMDQANSIELPSQVLSKCIVLGGEEKGGKRDNSRKLYSISLKKREMQFSTTFK